MKKRSSFVIALFVLYAAAYVTSGFLNVVHGEDDVLLQQFQTALEQAGVPAGEFTYRPDGTKLGTTGVPSTTCSLNCETDAGQESILLSCMDGFAAKCKCADGEDLAVAECLPKEGN
jgi:hypothetical protein